MEIAFIARMALLCLSSSLVTLPNAKGTFCCIGFSYNLRFFITIHWFIFVLCVPIQLESKALRKRPKNFWCLLVIKISLSATFLNLYVPLQCYFRTFCSFTPAV